MILFIIMKLSINHFDLLAPLYEKVIRSGNRVEFWKLVDIPKSGLLLDAGGGTGRVSGEIFSSSLSIIVTDLSLPMLREVKTKIGLNPACAPAENLPFVDGLFDRIIMVDAFHHVLDQYKTITELWRVLKPGGMIIIEEPDIDKFVVKLISLGEKIALMRSHFLDSREIAGLFSATCGIINIHQVGVNVLICVEKP
jgi:ubiquinone/menaquinone biosynthesis C-methylase UbiE